MARTSHAFPLARGTRLRPLLAVLVVVLLCVACGRKKPRAPADSTPPVGSTQVGIASWYGYPYHGRSAADGEIYDMEKFTAAHRTLPFGVWVRVHNLSNGKQVDVRITDRGPFVEDRVIDLSKAAARAIDMIGPGTAKVRLEIIATPARLSTSEWFAVQVGAFRDRANAERLRREMERRYGSARLVEHDGAPPLWRVLVGREPTYEHAQGLAQRVREQSRHAFVVRLDNPL